MVSPAWILPLAILAPVIFMWSNNWFMYSSQELLVSFSVLILICSFIFVAGHFIYSRLESRVSGELRHLCCFMFCMLFVGTLLTLLELPLQGVFTPESFLVRFMITGSIVASCLFFIVTRYGSRAAVIFLASWLFIFISCNNFFVYFFQANFVSFLLSLLGCFFIFLAGNIVYLKLENWVSGKLRKSIGCFMLCILFIGALLIFAEWVLELISQETFTSDSDNLMKFIMVCFIIASASRLVVMQYGFSPAVFFLLSWLFVFMLNNNFFGRSYQATFVPFASLLMASFVIVVAGNIIYSRFEKRINGKLDKYLHCSMLCMLFIGALLIFLDLILQESFTHDHDSLMKFIMACLVMAGASHFIVMKHGFKPIKLFLVSWLLLSIGTGLYSIISTSVLGEEKILGESEHIELVERPNIYLFILESYHDLGTMSDIYGIDTEPLTSYVASRGFSIYENVYSNSPQTLSSMTDMFGMRLNIAQAIGLHDITTIGRILIGGGLGNQVYRILKENNYHTVFLAPDPPLYYFYNKGIYLDETNIDLSNRISSARPLCESVPRLRRYCYGVKIVDNIQPKFRNSLVNNIRMIIEDSESKVPLFVGFKSGADHTISSGYTWRKKDEWVSNGQYQKSVNKGNQEIFEIVDLIIDKEPSAVIVLVGDHGSWRLRGIGESAGGDFAELEQILDQNGESLDRLAHDAFGTFLAIRMPGKGDISKGLPMSHVNLFRHIFAALADSTESDAILQRRAPSESDLGSLDSRLKGIKLVKEGVVQHPEKPYHDSE